MTKIKIGLSSVYFEDKCAVVDIDHGYENLDADLRVHAVHGKDINDMIYDIDLDHEDEELEILYKNDDGERCLVVEYIEIENTEGEFVNLPITPYNCNHNYTGNGWHMSGPADPTPLPGSICSDDFATLGYPEYYVDTFGPGENPCWAYTYKVNPVFVYKKEDSLKVKIVSTVKKLVDLSCL